MPTPDATRRPNRPSRRTALAVTCLLLVGGSATALRSAAATAQSGYPPGTIFYVGQNDTRVSTLSDGVAGDPVGTDLSDPRGLAVDADGNLYIADTAAGRVLRIESDRTSTTLADGLSSPSGVAVDGSGHVFIADTDGIVLLGSAGPQLIAAGFVQPVAVAVGPGGHLVVADAGADAVVDIAPDGTRTPVGVGFAAPRGLAVAPDGTVVVADTGNNRVVAVDRDGTMRVLASDLAQPGSLAIDGARTAYVADRGNNRIVAITTAGAESDVAHVAATTLATYVAAQTISFDTAAPATARVGSTYFAFATGGASGQPVVFSPSAASVGCTVGDDGAVAFTGIGTCVVDANQAGDAEFAPAGQEQQSIEVVPGAQFIEFSSSAPTDAVVGETYPASATGGGSGKPVLFGAGVDSAACMVTLHGLVRFVHFGTCTVIANQEGNTNWEPAAPQQQEIAVGPGHQILTLTSGAPANPVVGGVYVPAAVSSSGLPTAFSIDPSSPACTIDPDGVVSFVHAGTCTVFADQPGNDDWAAADQVAQMITIGRRAADVVFSSSPPDGAVVGQTYTAVAASSFGPVTFSADPISAGCTVAPDGTVDLVGAGTCVIAAAFAGDDDTEPGSATQSFVIAPGAQAISFSTTPPADARVGTGYRVSATGGASGNPVTFSADATSVGCTVAPDGTVQFTDVGRCVVDGDQVGTGDYDAAPRVRQTVSVAKGTQTILFASTPPAFGIVGEVYLASATGGPSGKSVLFKVATTSQGICTTTTRGTVTFVGVGACTVVATQPGTTQYLPAPTRYQVIKSRRAQVITFTSVPPYPAAVGGRYAVSATGGGSGLRVTFSIAPESAGICRISGVSVSYLAPGACTIVATQLQTLVYAPTTAKQWVTVYSAGQTSPIRHVVLIYQENHSFDETLGSYCTTRPTPCDGYVGSVRLKNGLVVPMTHGTDIVPNVDHSVAGQATAMDGGAMDGWAGIYGCNAPKFGCLTYYTPADIPNLTALADRFVVSDRTFSLADSPSWGGHLYAAAATLDGFTGDNPQPAPGVAPQSGWGCDSNKVSDWVSPSGTTSKQPSCVPNVDGSGPFTPSPVKHVSTIFNELDDQHMDWKIYGATRAASSGVAGFYGWSICPSFADCVYTPQVNNLVPSANVLNDAANGTLPAYSVVTPSTSSRSVVGSDTSQHNQASMTAGDDWIARVVSAIQNGPDWNSTAVFITYDDCGCFYDHVSPPVNPDGTRQGIRLPMVIVSPYAKAGYTDSNSASLASVLAFTERTLGLPALSVNDAAAYDYSASFDYAQPARAGAALHQVAVPKSSIAWAKAHPEDDDVT